MPKKQSPVWHVPHPRNKFFTGRAQVLDDIHRELTAGGKAALSGLGGMGKTQTVAEYAYRHRSEYRTVLWAKADSQDSLNADLVAIAATLNLPEKEKTDRDKVVTAVTRWLEAQAGWLLILDNADELGLVSDLLRREWDGHILLTTRAHATGIISSVEIKEMEPEEGALFILRRAKLIAADDALGTAEDADRELAEELTDEVGGLPLALDQAGAFIEEMSSSLGEYLELYRREGAQLRAKRGGVIVDHEPVTITFSLAFRQVESGSAAAADLLRACAFLAPDAIPEEFFVSGATELGENLAPVSGGGINLVKVIGEAGRFSLIRRHAKRGTIEIHRLVQQVLKDEMSRDERRLWAEWVIRALNMAFPDVEYTNWPLCDKLLTHAQEAARLVEEYNLEFKEAARLLNQAGCYCYGRAQYAEAEPLHVRALSIYEKSLGSDHQYVATSLTNLGNLYNTLGRYSEAESLCKRSISICEKKLGPDHLDVALKLNNLGGVYLRQGRNEEAEPLFRRALNIREKALAPDHPDIATSLNNLAGIYTDQKRNNEAEPLFRRALNIREKALAPDHPDIAIGLNNLAGIYMAQGRYGEAALLYQRSISICEKALGLDHPNTTTVRNNYTELLRKMRLKAGE